MEEQQFTKVEFNGDVMSLPEGRNVDAETVRESLKMLHPEIANAEYEVVGDTLKFTVRANTKG